MRHCRRTTDVSRGDREYCLIRHSVILCPDGAAAASAYLHSIPASAGKAYRMLRGNGITDCRSCGTTASVSSTEDGARTTPAADYLLARPAAEQPVPASTDRLAHEYRLKDELDSAWAIRPLELVREAGRTALMLEDPAANRSPACLGRPWRSGRSCARGGHRQSRSPPAPPARAAP